jgi:thiol-disulfide isomerase/thioredoxin
MIMKFRLLFALSLFANVICAEKVTINIYVEGFELDHKYIYLYNLGGHLVDSALITGGTGVFHDEIEIPSAYELATEKEVFHRFMRSFWVDKPIHNTKLFKNERNAWAVSIDSELHKSFEHSRDLIFKEFLAYFRNKDGNYCEHYSKIYNTLMLEFSKNSKFGISLVYLFWDEIERLIQEIDCEYEELKTLQKEVRDSIHLFWPKPYQQKRLKQSFTMLEGDMCEDFLFSTKNQPDNSLLNFTGEYLIIYFCASWCYGCDAAQQDFADHFKEKNKFKPFNLLYIKMDEFELPLHSSDQLSIRGIIPFEEERERVKSIYRITSYPFILLIDPEGYIIKRHSSPKEIQMLLLKQKNNSNKNTDEKNG